MPRVLARTSRSRAERPAPAAGHAQASALHQRDAATPIVGPVDDPLEHEAARAAGAIAAGLAAPPAPATPPGGRPPIAASPDPSTRPDHAEALAAARAVATGGRSLSRTARAYFEPRFGRDLSAVRLHDGAGAAAAARALDARAFALGDHIALGAEAPAPRREEARWLLAHEIAHVVQHVPGDRVIRRRNGTTTLPPMPRGRTFADMWSDFESVRDSNPARAAGFAAEMIPVMLLDETRRHGIDLLFWLLDNGRADLARGVLSNLSDAYMVDWATNRLLQAGPMWGSRTPDPAALVRRAETEARAGRHESAHLLFQVAYELAQMILIDLTTREHEALERRQADIGLDDEGRAVALAQASSFGIDVGTMLTVIRDIFGFYPGEERRARLAGDAEAARAASGLGFVLRLDLLENHTLSGDVLTMETVAAFNRFGQRGYELIGASGPSEIVTPLPGTPTPDELGLFPTFTSTLQSLVTAIAGQEEFVNGLMGEPEIQREFRGRVPDMNDRDQRLRVWSAMYRAYQRQDTLGMGVLHHLMSLMREYLQAFTRHTEYNIRDFGVSYLSSEFPTDLAGRAVRDCGVYALTVAYEVFRTARAARPALNLEFRLYSVPEHVTLVIFDFDAGRHYLVNNDQVSPSRRGGPNDPETLQSVANAYAQTFGRAFAITPMQDISLGTTRDTDAAFRQSAWRNYLVTTLWGLETPPGSDAQEVYRQYYEDLANFDRGGRRLQAQLDAASIAHRATSANRQAEQLTGAIDGVFPLGLALARTFDRYGPHARTVAEGDPARVRGVLGPGSTPQGLGRTLGARQYLYAHQPGTESSAHPIARLAGALLRLQQLGGVLTPDQQALVTWVRTVPGLDAMLQRYVAGGLGPTF
jgi:hypothetical protein